MPLDISSTYTGTVAINKPLALGVLDISLILTDTDGTLSGRLNDGGTLAFSGEPALQGSIDTTSSITPTFQLQSEPFESTVSGRRVTRRFSIEGEIHNEGDVILGRYAETIDGFTPKTLTVSGLFLASRPVALASAAVVPDVTPVPGDTATPSAANEIYLPHISNREAGVQNATEHEAVLTPTPSHRLFLPQVDR